MKKLVSVILTIAMVFTLLGAFIVCADEDFTLAMQIDNPIMTVNGAEQEIDEGMGTTPVIRNERTLVPIRAIIEAMGGTVGWEAATQTATLNYSEDEIRLVIDSETAYLNNEPNTLDSAPVIINERTMLPIRFIAESFKFNVKWDGDTQVITITKAKTEEPDAVSSATQVEETPSPETTPEATPEASSKILVAYFSRTGENYSVGEIDKGNTSYIADYIAEQTGADVFEILAEEPYPHGYEDTKTRATNERNANARPNYIGEVPNFEQYDTVFLGYPIWWGDMPMIMYTFLENHDFSGKKVCPFNTHEGSGNAGTASTIRSKLPQATVTDYLAVRGSDAQRNDTSMKNTVAAWLKKLGYTE